MAVAPLPGLSQVNARDQCASVLLPPAQAQRVMIIGGAPGRGDAVRNVDIVDFSLLRSNFGQVTSAHQPRLVEVSGKVEF